VRGGPRLVAIVLAVTAGASVLAAPQSNSRGRTDDPAAVERALEDAISAYAGGDDNAVDRWMAPSVSRTRVTATIAALARPAPWSPSRAAFALELANALREPALFTAARSMVTRRPAPLGVDPAGDRFEVLFHHSAIAALQEGSRVKLLAEYVNAVHVRFEDARQRGVVLETRLPLARAFTSALVCCWKRVFGDWLRTFEGITRSGVTLDVALSQFEEAAQVPALRSEALIRGAKLLYDGGRQPEALAWIERVPEHADPVIGYLQHWIQARMLDDLGRAEDAAAAYRRALTFGPQSQPASIGLAAALLRAGRFEEATNAAADARSMQVVPPTEIGRHDFSQPTSTFQRGDSRFIQQWLADLRSLVR
jgi:tetratricopeptide (TPR) repeat protein